MKTYFKARCAAVMLIAAGYGWAGGHYIPPKSDFLAYLFHVIVIGTVLLLGIAYFSLTGNEQLKRNWPVRGLNIFSTVSLFINILNVVHGAINHDPHSFGSHNTFADLVPVAILITGSGLWVITMVMIMKSKDQNHVV